jgi:hypothetical protein
LDGVATGGLFLDVSCETHLIEAIRCFSDLVCGFDFDPKVIESFGDRVLNEDQLERRIGDGEVCVTLPNLCWFCVEHL